MSLRKVATRSDGVHPPDPPPAPAPVERYQGTLLGCALGDAVGAWAEAKDPAEAKDYAVYFVREFDFTNVGPHHHGMRMGQYTDDTQLTRELMLSLIDEGEFVPEDFANRIANAFAKDEIVGYGRATQEAAVKLLDGISWEDSGTPPPRAGNGAAMRAGPLGMLYYHDAETLLKTAQDQAVITHKAEMSVAGSVAIAMGTAMCLNASKLTSGPHERGWWAWLARFVGRNSEEFGRDIDDLAKMVFEGRRKTKWKAGEGEEYDTVLAWILEGDDHRWSGISPWARSSVLWSFYCLMAHPRDIWKAIELAIIPGGDVDTTAAMAGTLVGAHIGITKFPKQALEIVAPLIHDVKSERYTWDGLTRIANTLHGIVADQYQERLTAWEIEQAKVIPLDQGK